MKKFLVFIILFTFIITYFIFLQIRVRRIELLHDPKLKELRDKLDLQPFNNNWILDTTEILGLGNYTGIEKKNISKLKLYFENEKLYCQKWIAHDNLIKKYFYFRSIWIWKNKIIAEADNYKYPIDTFKNVEINTLYEYYENDWFCTVDTTDSDYKIQNEKDYLDSLEKAFPTAVSERKFLKIHEIDSLEVSVEKARKIIYEFKQKNTNP